MKCFFGLIICEVEESPPARVVWIEISKKPSDGKNKPVATREGGVD